MYIISRAASIETRFCVAIRVTQNSVQPVPTCGRLSSTVSSRRYGMYLIGRQESIKIDRDGRQSWCANPTPVQPRESACLFSRYALRSDRQMTAHHRTSPHRRTRPTYGRSVECVFAGIGALSFADSIVSHRLLLVSDTSEKISVS